MAKMIPLTIVRGKKELNALVSGAITSYKNASHKMHVAVVSALVHAAETGRAQPLTRLYNALNTNDQQALRGSYINRIHAALGGVDFMKYAQEDQRIPSEVMAAAKEAGMFLGFGKNESTGESGFFVLSKDTHPNAPKNKAAFVALAEKHLLDPKEDEGWRRFFDRNNMAEQKVFADDDALKVVDELFKKASGEKAGFTAKVSSPVLKALAKARDTLHSIKEANEVHDEVEHAEAPA